MLTEKTENAFMCIELVDDARIKDLSDALSELSELVKENLGGEYEIHVLDIDNREAVIG